MWKQDDIGFFAANADAARSAQVWRQGRHWMWAVYFCGRSIRGRHRSLDDAKSSAEIMLRRMR